MSDFEDRLRRELNEAADPLGPTPGFRADVDRRVRRHRRVRVAQMAMGVAGAVLLLAGLGLLLSTNERGGESQTFANPSSTSAPPGSLQPIPAPAPGGVNDPSPLLPCEWSNLFASPYVFVVPEIASRYLGLTEAEARAQASADGRDLMTLAELCDSDGNLVLSGGGRPGFIDVLIDEGEVVAVAVEGVTLEEAIDPTPVVSVP